MCVKYTAVLINVIRTCVLQLTYSKIKYFTYISHNISQVHNVINRFEKNFRFTVDMFQKEALHFLDFELLPNVCYAHNGLIKYIRTCVL